MTDWKAVYHIDKLGPVRFVLAEEAEEQITALRAELAAKRDWVDGFLMDIAGDQERRECLGEYDESRSEEPK